ncbi:hypothetical protein [Pseudarthrobacter polychromogenes]|uniref:hypothetical protein n=1 Tax=Pseudarthrobacter polychromogenes TaxID=1676 RepID=UPI001E34B6A8|nr:hypothetical protein [Pseudarthrobacter polychromogenes]
MSTILPCTEGVDCTGVTAPSFHVTLAVFAAQADTSSVDQLRAVREPDPHLDRDSGKAILGREVLKIELFRPQPDRTGTPHVLPLQFGGLLWSTLAEYERELIIERVNADAAAASQNGTRSKGRTGRRRPARGRWSRATLYRHQQALVARQNSTP